MPFNPTSRNIGHVVLSRLTMPTIAVENLSQSSLIRTNAAPAEHDTTRRGVAQTSVQM